MTKQKQEKIIVIFVEFLTSLSTDTVTLMHLGAVTEFFGYNPHN